MSLNRPAGVEHPLELISAYMDGRLEAADRARIHEHLRGCAACSSILADFRALAVAARREAAPPIPAYLLEKIGRRIDTETEARPSPRLRFFPRARLPLATAAAVMVLASLWVVWRGRPAGERAAESRSDAAAPVSGPSAEQPPSTQPPSSQPPSSQPGTASVPPTGPGGTGKTTAFAPSPAAPPSAIAGRRPIKKDGAAQGGAFADREENKISAPLARQAVPAPQQAKEPSSVEVEGAMGEWGEEGSALAEGMAGMAKSADTGTTLVVVLPEARVSVLADLGVVLKAGDYICPLPAGGQDEVRALAELRAYAAGQWRSAAAGPDDARLAARNSPAGGVPRELVVPAPPDSGALSPEAAAEARRRIWTVLRDSLLARAEAQCGPAPPALQPER